MSILHPKERFCVFGVTIDAVSMDGALEIVAESLSSENCQYACAVSVHGVVESQKNNRLRDAFEYATLKIPDGMPIAWVGRALGLKFLQRVTGPDLMMEVFSQPEFASCRHYLYGGEEGVAQKLQQDFSERFPKVTIVGASTPPFREFTDTEELSLLGKIKALAPDIVWVGLGCPKQEIFMTRMAERMPAHLMVGVGAAFDFHTGRLRDCSPLVKKLGFQWLHRLLQDPRRLWRRYLKSNSSFLWLLATSCFRPSGLALEQRDACESHSRPVTT